MLKQEEEYFAIADDDDDNEGYYYCHCHFFKVTDLPAAYTQIEKIPTKKLEFQFFIRYCNENEFVDANFILFESELRSSLMSFVQNQRIVLNRPQA